MFYTTLVFWPFLGHTYFLSAREFRGVKCGFTDVPQRESQTATYHMASTEYTAMKKLATLMRLMLCTMSNGIMNILLDMRSDSSAALRKAS